MRPGYRPAHPAPAGSGGHRCRRARTGGIVTAEEHLLHGGMGSNVARVVAAAPFPVPMRFVGLADTYANLPTPPTCWSSIT